MLVVAMSIFSLAAGAGGAGGGACAAGGVAEQANAAPAPMHAPSCRNLRRV